MKPNDIPAAIHRPARFARQTRAYLHNIPFVEDKNYIRADRWDRWAAVVIGIAVLIVVALDSAWLMGWLP